MYTQNPVKHIQDSFLMVQPKSSDAVAIKHLFSLSMLILFSTPANLIGILISQRTMSTTFHLSLSIALAILEISIISISRFSIMEANNGGFSVELIHRDSPKSPIYDPSLTPLQRMNNALRRSYGHANRFLSFSPETASAGVIPYRGEYFMNLSIGTPSIETLSIVDTGSDLIWIQCQPCTHCYKQKLPVFRPDKSSSYKALPCGSRTCQAIQGTSCFPTAKTCLYWALYNDRSYTRGDLATEMLTLGSSTGKLVSLPDIVFGCGHDNDGTFSDGGSGIIGLGVGQPSLISQMGSSIGGKFSYCLVQMFAQNATSSKLNFGDSGVGSGSGVVSTPLVIKPQSNFYFLTLEGISVEGKRLDYYNSSLSPNASRLYEEGNIIIDSGTTLTFLTPDLYLPLQWAVKRAIKLPTVKDPEGLLSLCYSSLDPTDVPIITAHFKDADLKLNPLSTFRRTSSESICFAFALAENISVFGNMVQMNFLVGYDIQKKTVSFEPTDCTKH